MPGAMLKRLLTLTALFVALSAVLPAAHALAAGSHLRYAIDSNPSFADLERTARRQGIVVLQAWRLDELRALKAANPNVKVLVYKNLSFAAQGGVGPGGLSSSGVSYREAEENPQWFLKNTAGERFASGGYSWLWAMDVGSPAFQDRWADNVVSEVRNNGWDGVFLDDTNPTMKYHYDVSRVAKYPSDRAYTAATTSALAHIGPRVRNAGKLAVPNNAAWVEYYDVGVDWLQYVDGVMDEMFLKWSQRSGEGYRDEAQWNTQLNEIKAAERQGKMFLGVTQSGNDDHGAALYGYATTLLATQGNAHFAMHGDYTNENWFEDYDLDIGSPAASESRDANGVHRRPFTRGMVLVNPTSSTQTASLPGEYTGPEVGRVTRVTLAAHRGVVLEKVGAEPEPPKPPAPVPPVAGSLLATVNDAGDVALSWPLAGPAGSVRYKVSRGARPLGEVGRRGFVDWSSTSGVHTYRVAALDSARRTVRISRVRVAVSPVSASLSARRGYGTVRGFFSSPSLSRWQSLSVQRRDGPRDDWARASVRKPPTRTSHFRVDLGESADVRMVVSSRDTTRRTLTSPAVPLGVR